MKVLHIFPEFRRGGAPVNTLRFIKASCDSLVHIAAGSAVDVDFVNDFRPYAETWDVNLTKPSPGSFLKLLRRTKEEVPDIVHANGKSGMFYGLLLFLFLPRDTRFFLTLRGFHDKYSGMKSRFYRFLERIMARRVEAVICVSPSERQHYLTLIKADKDKVLIIPNGIDVHEVELPSQIDKVCRNFQVNIVSLSRTSPQKDLETMIRSFEIAASGRKDTALHIMGGLSHGEEEYQKRIYDLWKSSSVSEKIFFWGDVKEAGNLISNFSIYLSTARFEGLPTAVVESFLSRIPVVGTDCIGNIDLIRDNETGWLTDIGDFKDTGKALSKAIDSIGSKMESEIIDNAYNEALQYSIENQAIRLLALYGL
ncbi:MAG: hypothetical protein DRZ90_17010 [Spirochaetes bacterium]|nr:MAG: hypothetical protein DRZ90_17010 [Spirochaetota bacterium]